MFGGKKRKTNDSVRKEEKALREEEEKTKGWE